MAPELHFFTRNGLSGTCQLTGSTVQRTAYVLATKLNQPGQPGPADIPVVLAGSRTGNGSLSLDFTALNPAPDQPVLIFGYVISFSPMYQSHFLTACGPLPAPAGALPSIVPRHAPEIVRR